MKSINTLLIGLFLSFSFTSIAQLDEAECRKYRSLAGEEIKLKNYRNAADMYLKAMTFCDACEEASGNTIVYDNMKFAFSELWKAEKDEVRKKELADSVEWIYTSRIEKCGTVTDKWKGQYGYFLFKSKRDYEKAANLLNDYVRIKKEKAGLNYIYGQYKATYYTYKKTKLNSWRDSLITKYFVYNEYLDLLKDGKQGKYVPKIRAGIEDILMGKILKDCDEISKVLETKVGQFADMTKEAKLEFCTKAVGLLEKKKCVDQPIYLNILETQYEVLADSLKAKGAYDLGKYNEDKKDYKKAADWYAKAVIQNSDPAVADKYKMGKLRMMFRKGNYKAAFSLAKSIGGEYKGDALKLAAQCIAQTANTCGVSTILRKANYYLAMDYLEKAKANGASVGGLMASYAKNAPTKEEKFKESWQAGKSITLECWGEATKVRD